MRHSSEIRRSEPSPDTISAVSFWRGFRSPCSPRIVTVSSPFSPIDCQDAPSSKVNGSTPMPTRLERWMRSKLWQITARTPSSRVPFAAQAPRGAVSVFGAGKNHQRDSLGLILHRGIVDRHLLAVGPVLGQAALGN